MNKHYDVLISMSQRQKFLGYIHIIDKTHMQVDNSNKNGIK